LISIIIVDDIVRIDVELTKPRAACAINCIALIFSDMIKGYRNHAITIRNMNGASTVD
jgi:hypothetical protein